MLTCIQAQKDTLENISRLPGEITYRGLSDKTEGKYGHKDSISDDRLGSAVVELVKKEGCSLGLVIAGGVDKDERPRILSLRPGSIAHRSDVVQEGDYISAVNGIRTALLKHEEILNLLKNASNVIMLEIEYPLPDQPPQDTFSVMCKRVEVTLTKDKSSYGFMLRGGIQDEIDKSRPLTITNVRRGSVADRNGCMQPGDRLLCINGMNVSQCSLPEVLQMLKQRDEVTLLLEYDVSVMESRQNASGPLMIEVERAPGGNLGITLSSEESKDTSTIWVEAIKSASIADRSGALRVADQILMIDDHSLDHVTVPEALQLLKAGTSSHVKLQINPVMTNKVKPMSRGSSKSSVSTCNSANGHGPPSHPDPFGSQETRSSSMSSSSKGPRIKNPNPGNIPLIEVTNLAGTVLATQNAVCHRERMEVTMLPDQRGVGFNVTADAFSSDLLSDPPFIGQVDRHGPAAKTGVIQEGDRLLSINGESLKGRSLEEVRALLKQVKGAVSLEIEFDVADSVIPNSGVFYVKLAKNGSGLGITIRSTHKKSGGTPMLISAVHKGSLAYRTGTIQAGDKLLAIDSLRTDQCTLEDAAQLLRDTETIVNLKIKKAEPLPELAEQKNSVSYTVELQKNGGLLGITICGTDHHLEPIFISSVAEGGLAEKTGTLHVGDRILAINGKSLWGRPLQDAIEMLQSAGDVVTLKVSKNPHPTKRKAELASKSFETEQDGSLERIGTPIPSVDSALESWDSSDSNQKTSNKDSHSKHGQAGTFDDLKNELRLDEEDWSSHPSSGVPSIPSHTSSLENGVNGQMVEGDDNKSNKDEGIPNLPQEKILDRIETSLSRESAGIPIKGDFQHMGYTVGSFDDLDNLDLLENLSDMSENFSTSSRIQSAEVQLQEVDEQLQTIFKPTPVELIRVTLYKWKENDDFGFSLSDGVYEKGVYISAMRPGGPADKTMVLKPFDKILQINGLKIKDLDCQDVCPLILESGNMVELVVSRNPIASKKGRKQGEPIWVKRDERSLRGHRV